MTSAEFLAAHGDPHTWTSTEIEVAQNLALIEHHQPAAPAPAGVDTPASTPA